MARIGYARVSTTDQDAALQLDALNKAGCDRIYTDNGVSGTKASRPELDKMLDHLRSDDVVVIWKFDRLGRNTKNLLDLVETIEAKGCGFESLTERIDTTGPMGKAMLTIMSAFAQLERDQIVERTRAGLAEAAKNNRHGGRPRKADAAAVARAHDLKGKGVAVPEIAKMLEVSRATVYRYLSESTAAAV
ncbi:recombinase family protein [Crystallibacter degradans]|uniref:recombinase family protein n=1 Tax=Crystallibacter degradans TaxID=2726743 RepID=UPI00147334DD|nr:recombinase family protein [Arthrobacter sp. SF27]NMR29946.1 recombinase family protein [Arthrobacter sp. SF27]